jgi:hypothetical protein
MRRLPWSISTTVRNPERLQQFLRVLAEFEGRTFDTDVQKDFQIRLIQEKLYEPTSVPSELIQRYMNPMHTLSFDEAREIFEHQRYKDPPMRGRQSANPLNKLGLAVAIQRLGEVRITPAGRLLLDNPSQSSEILFRCLLKLQFPNPLSRDFREEYGFYIAPFTAVLRLLDYLRTKGKNGLTQTEFCYFVTTWLDIRELEAQAERILQFARLSGKKRTDYLQEWLKEFYGKEVSFKDTKVSNLFDYGDNTMRYFRYTKYFSVVGSLGSWFIDIEPTRAKEVEMLLQEMDGTPKMFKQGTLSNYLEYIGNPDLPELPWRSNEKLCIVIRDLQEQFRQLGFMTEASNRLITASPSPLASSSELEQWLSDLRTLLKEQSLAARLQQNKWQASVLSNLQATLLKTGKQREQRLEPADLEKLITDILIAIDDADDILPNYPMDDLGNPISHAPGNRPDIECQYKDFRLVVEVTLDSSKNQWFREGQPVMRHLREFENRFTDSLPTFCIFLAPRVHQDTYSQFWIAVRYEYDGRPQKIVPMDFQQFGQVLGAIVRHLEAYRRFDSLRLLELLDKSVSVSSLEGYNQWREHICKTINEWCNTTV